MGSDQAAQVQPAPAPRQALPAITAVDIRAARYTARASKHVAAPLADVGDAVHIDLTLDGPVPIRALSPVLWVGAQRLTECEAVDESGTTLRFWGLNPGVLTDGAPLALAWMNEAPQSPASPAARGAKAGRGGAGFVYKAPR